MIQQFAESISPQHAVWITVAIKVTIAATVVLPAVNVIAIVAVWAERKIAGHIQSRLGPMHVGPQPEDAGPSP